MRQSYMCLGSGPIKQHTTFHVTHIVRHCFRDSNLGTSQQKDQAKVSGATLAIASKEEKTWLAVMVDDWQKDVLLGRKEYHGYRNGRNSKCRAPLKYDVEKERKDYFNTTLLKI